MGPQRIVGTWTDTILKSLEIATQSTSLGLGPPPVARLLAIIYTSAFEAWAPYTKSAKGPVNGATLRRAASERTVENKAEAISQAIYVASLAMFSPNPAESAPRTDPEILAILNSALTKLGYSPAGGGTPNTSPAGIGRKAPWIPWRHARATSPIRKTDISTPPITQARSRSTRSLLPPSMRPTDMRSRIRVAGRP